MIKESVELFSRMEDQRREDTYAKILKRGQSVAKVKVNSKNEIPMDSVTISIKMEEFSKCYKKINKRITDAKKNAKANKDLKGV